MAGKHVLSVCVFCFICATHSPCSSHADVSDINPRHLYSPRSPYYDDSSTGNHKQLPFGTENRHKLRKRDSTNPRKTAALDKANIERVPLSDLETIGHDHKLEPSSLRDIQTKKNLKKIFKMFGDGESITIDGLEKLLDRLSLRSIELTDLVQEERFDETKNVLGLSQTEQASDCLNKSDLMNSDKNISNGDFYSSLCPNLLYGLVVGICPNDVRPSRAARHYTNPEHNITLPQAHTSSEGASERNEANRTLVWVYSICAVCVISFCGILGLAVIPIMQKTFYEPLLQFLVALAVGTLAGDALLHLLPHAMSSHSHSPDTAHEQADHNTNTWKGLVAMGGLVLFFVMERVIMFASKWHKSQQLKNKQPTRLKVIDPDKSTSVTSAADKQCKHKYSSFPYCYDEIKMIDHRFFENIRYNSTAIPHLASLDQPVVTSAAIKQHVVGSDDIIVHSGSQHRCNSFPHIEHSHSHPNIAECDPPKQQHLHQKACSNGLGLEVDGSGDNHKDASIVCPARIRTAGDSVDCLEQNENLMRKDGGDYERMKMHMDDRDDMDVSRMNGFVQRLNTQKTLLCQSNDGESHDFSHQSRHLGENDHIRPSQNQYGHQHSDNSSGSARPPMNKTPSADSGEYTVILREHRSEHHGHSHAHGHVHAAPSDLSAVVWMVIMGDGLHNFTDGMAIGAAFSSSITGGLSTALAVFFHEVPHELGDFAMLLKAGMSMRQALFYNLLSSVLCLAGNAFGVWLGETEEATSWVFAAAAGMFIYIALVDMIPELSAAHEGGGGTLLQCVLHTGGLLLGVGIMLLIACYEFELKQIFNDF